MPSADADIYRALGQAFAEMGVRWYVFGAQAAILYGAARLTEDIDVTVELGERSTRALLDALRKRGFTPRVGDEDFIARTRVVPFVHDATGVPVDVVLAGPGIEEVFFAGAAEREVEGVRIRVARAEDIVVMKMLAGRPKDLEDVAAILVSQGSSFDRDRVVELLALLEGALDQRDLLPSFEAICARVRRSHLP